MPGRSVGGAVHFFLRFTRFESWLSTLESNLVASFLLLLLGPFKQSNFVYFLFFIIFQFFLLAYAFVLNDVCDKNIDIMAGKNKPIHRYSKKRVALILSVLAGSSLCLPLIFGNLLVKVASLVALALSTFYSVKPIRFKERGILGIIVADGTQRSLLFLIFALFISGMLLPTIFFFCWLFIIGFQDELGHQLRDRENDEKTRANTWAPKIGYNLGEKVLIASLAASLIYLCLSFLFFEFYTACAISAALIIFRIRNYLYIYGTTVRRS
jgi:4-hydroxybenzoate polyprenyltransferase